MEEIRIGRNSIICYNNDHVDMSTDEIINTWGTNIHLLEEDSSKNISGLRKPQLGAIYAIKSHWTVSEKIATIVMPTGTGKTDAMIANILSEQCKKTLIVVPSVLLRDQIAEKCVNLDTLKKIGVVSPSILHPKVLNLKTVPDESEVRKLFEKSNIIISTVTLLNSLVSKESKEFDDSLSLCTHLIFDEAHHAKANSWDNLRKLFISKRILQFTATPFREDGKKLEGKIIYNFTLSLAQKMGYFQEIVFSPVQEFDDEKIDHSIASKAVACLKQDLQNGYEHILLVRCKTKKRADDLFQSIYSKYVQFNPVLIHGGVPSNERKENKAKIESLESRILVCVDMFSEGIDIPNLKIVAIHDKYKSLPITLQFVGRFARTQKMLGKATVVTNILDDDINGSILSGLYSVDADWNSLLSIMSEDIISAELDLQDFTKNFEGNAIEEWNLSLLKPTIRTITYKTTDSNWHWKSWKKVFNEEKCRYLVDETRKVLIVFEMKRRSVKWTSLQEIEDISWNLHIVYWNEKEKLAFVNTSSLSTSNAIAGHIFPNNVKVDGEDTFRCLHEINRLMFANVGLRSNVNGLITYRMFAGMDVKNGVSQALRNISTKSNMFGTGYNGDGKISIGCTYKGKIWLYYVENIKYWIDWCDKIGVKLLDTSIDVSNIFEGVIIPEQIKEMPIAFPYRIDLPFELNLKESLYPCINIPLIGNISFSDIDIYIKETTKDNSIIFTVSNENFLEEYKYTLKKDGFIIESITGNVVQVITRDSEISLREFLQNNPPKIWYANNSSLEGNLLATTKKELPPFPKENIVKWDWEGVNIKKESRYNSTSKSIELDSIQNYTIDKLKKNPKYTIVFDDDGAGEIADIIAIYKENKTVVFELYHCKFSEKTTAGARVGDLYEVCGQAERSVSWKMKTQQIATRMLKREKDRLSNSEWSRFMVGNEKNLNVIHNELKVYNSVFKIFIVQPGVDSDRISQNMNDLLATSQSYLLDTFSIPFHLICT